MASLAITKPIQNATQPVVSLLVAMHNEARYIERCLASLLAQNYPPEKLEIWVFDGESSDQSRQIVERMFTGRPNTYLVENPGITQANGWNLGIKLATGDILGIVSAHAEVGPDYVSRAVETLQRTGADLVGGPMRAIGTGRVGQAVALATSTPFGVGGARFHYAEREEEVDTVYMGLCWKKTYQWLGDFDPEMVRNQDDELSYRLLELGGRIICNPSIRSRYHNRATFRTLWRQYFQYGYWKVRVMQKHPRQMSLRHFAPPAFVAVLLTSLLLAPLSAVGTWLFGLVVGSYVLANLGASLVTVRKGTWRVFPWLPATFTTIHLSWGLGFLVGLVRFWNRWGGRANPPSGSFRVGSPGPSGTLTSPGSLFCESAKGDLG
jgi:cellulose synthase/poly-beta-1,6-N-acetylglucosamine synthase-like glycosyltransferase